MKNNNINNAQISKNKQFINIMNNYLIQKRFIKDLNKFKKIIN